MWVIMRAQQLCDKENLKEGENVLGILMILNFYVCMEPVFT